MSNFESEQQLEQLLQQAAQEPAADLPRRAAGPPRHRCRSLAGAVAGWRVVAESGSVFHFLTTQQ